MKLRNLSEEGALIEGERLPLEGTRTFFERNELRLKSRVVWVHGRYAGIAFDERLDPEQVLRNVPTPKAEESAADGFQAPRPRLPPLSDYERRCSKRWRTASPRGSLGD